MRTTKASTEFKVRQSLLRMGTATIGQIATVNGLAYNTVKTTLLATGAEQMPDTWPRKWCYVGVPIQTYAEGMPKLKAEEKDLDIALSIAALPDWATRWEAVRKEFGATIRLMAVVPEADPKQLAEDLARGAQSLAGLAYALQQVADRPDWYEILGGDTEAKA